MFHAIWKSYLEKDYVASFQRSVTRLAEAGGIDLLHITGLSLMHLGRREEGLLLMKAATTFRPQSAHIYINSAHIAEQCGMIKEVEYFTSRGLVDFPDNSDLLLLKANALIMSLEFDAASAIYRQLLERDPNHVQAAINLGNFHRSRDEFTEAEAMFARAEEIEPGLRDVIFARCTMYAQLGKSEEAKALLETIPEDVDAKFLLALLYLSDGDYLRGFELYRARGQAVWYRHGQFVFPLHPMDHWQEATGKNIAVLQEGGLGDLLQFSRYIPMLAEVTQSLSYFVPEEMMRLMRYNMPDEIICRSSRAYDDEEFDYITTDVEMPYHFRTTWETIPTKTPPLKVDPLVVEKRKLPPTKNLRVGLCWAGGARDSLNQRSYDNRRSISLDMLAPLAEIERVEFVSLQMGDPASQTGLPVTHVLEPDFDFMDTGAIVAQLDLVISVDTSVAHLAASLGVRTWLLSRFDCCWRWNHNRPDSPWYPDVLRVFGQQRYRDWSDPLNEITQALKEFTNA